MTKAKRISPLTLVLIIIGSIAIGAIASSLLFGQKSADINNTPGDYFDTEITVPAGQELIPGDTMTINPTMTNKSNGAIYAFMKVNYDSSIYDFDLAEGSSWKIVDGESNVYAYAEGSSMISVAEGEYAALDGTLSVKEDVAVSSLTESNMKVTVTGCGLLTSTSESGIVAAWERYQELEAGGQ